jgi:formylmethanofuran dehydrogenase subunit A
MVVDEKNIVRRQKVSVGIRQGKIVEVVSGLKAGDRVIVAGLQHVRPGISVRIGSGKKQETGKSVKSGKSGKSEMPVSENKAE